MLRSSLRYMLGAQGRSGSPGHFKDSGQASQTHLPLEGCRLRARRSRPGAPPGSSVLPLLEALQRHPPGSRPRSRGPVLKFEGQMGNSHLESCGRPLPPRTWRGSLLHTRASGLCSRRRAHSVERPRGRLELGARPLLGRKPSSRLAEDDQEKR